MWLGEVDVEVAVPVARARPPSAPGGCSWGGCRALRSAGAWRPISCCWSSVRLLNSAPDRGAEAVPVIARRAEVGEPRRAPRSSARRPPPLGAACASSAPRAAGRRRSRGGAGCSQLAARLATIQATLTRLETTQRAVEWWVGEQAVPAVEGGADQERDGRSRPCRSAPAAGSRARPAAGRGRRGCRCGWRPRTGSRGSCRRASAARRAAS